MPAAFVRRASVNSKKSDERFARDSSRLKVDEWVTVGIEHKQMGHLERVGRGSLDDDLRVADQRRSASGSDRWRESVGGRGASDSTVWVSLS